MNEVKMQEKEFKHYFQNIKRPGANKLLAWLEEEGFFTAPLNTCGRGAYTGALVKRTNGVYRRLVKMAEEDEEQGKTLPRYSAETIAIVGLLHNVWKADAYIPKATEPEKWEYTERFPVGYAEKSIIQITRFMPLTEEEMLAIRWGTSSDFGSVYGGGLNKTFAFKQSELVVMLYMAYEEEKTK